MNRQFVVNPVFLFGTSKYQIYPIKNEFSEFVTFFLESTSLIRAEFTFLPLNRHAAIARIRRESRIGQCKTHIM